MMQYYRIGETLEPLESLPPEEKSILAVLRPYRHRRCPSPAVSPGSGHADAGAMADR